MLENSFAFLSEPIPSNRAAYRAHAFVKFQKKGRVALVAIFPPKPRSTCLRKRWSSLQPDRGSDRNWPHGREIFAYVRVLIPSRNEQRATTAPTCNGELLVEKSPNVLERTWRRVARPEWRIKNEQTFWKIPNLTINGETHTCANAIVSNRLSMRLPHLLCNQGLAII